MSESSHAHPNYIKVWGILIVLLILSVLGPEIGNKWVTVLAAFGIAIWKTYLVASNFMHLKFEKHIIWFLLLISVVLLGVFFFGVSSDILKTEGQQWQDCFSNENCKVVMRY